MKSTTELYYLIILHTSLWTQIFQSIELSIAKYSHIQQQYMMMLLWRQLPLHPQHNWLFIVCWFHTREGRCWCIEHRTVKLVSRLQIFYVGWTILISCWWWCNGRKCCWCVSGHLLIITDTTTWPVWTYFDGWWYYIQTNSTEKIHF